MLGWSSSWPLPQILLQSPHELTANTNGSWCWPTHRPGQAPRASLSHSRDRDASRHAMKNMQTHWKTMPKSWQKLFSEFTFCWFRTIVERCQPIQSTQKQQEIQKQSSFSHESNWASLRLHSAKVSHPEPLAPKSKEFCGQMLSVQDPPWNN